MGYTGRLQFVGGEQSYPHMRNGWQIARQLDRAQLPPFLRPVPGTTLKSLWVNGDGYQELTFSNGWRLNVFRLDIPPTMTRKMQRQRDNHLIGAKVERVEFFDNCRFVIEFTGGFLIWAETTK